LPQKLDTSNAIVLNLFAEATTHEREIQSRATKDIMGDAGRENRIPGYRRGDYAENFSER
jgi:hypothetical protein